ncbi:glycosyltransferase family 4 protein [Haloarcula sediminis]|uniref:glycosyltransferase family 4 protein n=1 Tax=Haloarcula sediminis TaxID=3111777 RepID=UPI002D777A10|nr:glycosyltransferase family 1 protein [Haloarcula sp. CK38]
MTSPSGDLTVGIVIADLDAGGAPWNYIKNLPIEFADDDRVTPVVVYRRGDPDQFDAHVDTIKLPDKSYPTSWLPERPFPIRVRSVEKRRDIDLFHLNAIPDLGHWFALESTAPVIATVHGTLHWENLPIEVQTWSYRLRRRWFDRLGRFSLDRLLTVSDYVRETMVERAGYRPEQVMTTYEAIDNCFFSLPPSDGLVDAPDEYLLHVSNAAQKKNIQTLLGALKRLHDAGRSLELVVAGDRWESTGPELVEKYGLAEDVHFAGYVSQERLVHLYDEALCFVYPSYHETFGLPNVEAMARGTPVVTTAAYAIPEIVGNAAITVENPHDMAALADAIRTVIDDTSLQRRLIDNGLQRAQRFRWDTHCDHLVKTYSRVLATE